MEIAALTESRPCGTMVDWAGQRAEARPSGALWLPALRILAVADLHLGRAERQARLGGTLLPPFEGTDTLARLAAEIDTLAPETVICVGDSLDDTAAAAGLSGDERAALSAMVAGRRWVWIGGNHDPRPTGLGGAWAERWQAGGLVFRHIATPDGGGEISGHYHPKATVILRGRRLTRRCFLHDARRVILPAFGTYTGGLDATDAAFDALLGPGAIALLTGRRVVAVPRAALVPR